LERGTLFSIFFVLSFVKPPQVCFFIMAGWLAARDIQIRVYILLGYMSIIM